MTALNPQEIVKRTPKTNCGKCSHPTCLAFAVAVARGGENPARCPYLEMTGLDYQPAAGAKDLDNLLTQKDLELAKTLREKISRLDFAAIAPSLGVTWEKEAPDRLLFTYLARPVALSKSSLLINGREPEDPRDQILLYNYIASQGGREPTGAWIGLESLPNSISKVRTLTVYCEEKIARDFSEPGATKLRELGEKLGGIPGPAEHGADCNLIIPVLPKVPLYLLFWNAEPEDGFAARVKILFDQHVLDFLDLESLVFTAERLAERLAGSKVSPP